MPPRRQLLRYRALDGRPNHARQRRSLMKTVLFLCTGNYYRSRFAEELFNHWAEQYALDWAARSRALAIERGKANVGPISRLVVHALEKKGIQPQGHARMPAPCV